MEKETRKVNLVGKNTLTVSLPAKFVNFNHISKGDELFSYFENNEIVFGLTQKKYITKEIDINIDTFSYQYLSRYLSMLYISNYNKIVLTYSIEKFYDHKKTKNETLNTTIRRIINRFLGAEIVSQTSKQTIIECFIKNKHEDLEQIEKRVYFLIKEVTGELINNIGTNYSNFHETTYELHDNIDKFIYYFLRQLDATNKDEHEKKVAYAFYNLMSSVADKIRHLSEKINQYGCTNKIINYLTNCFDLFFDQFILLYKPQKLEELFKKRYKLKQKIENEQFNTEELQILSELSIFIDSINRFAEYGLIKSFVLKKK